MRMCLVLEHPLINGELSKRLVKLMDFFLHCFIYHSVLQMFLLIQVLQCEKITANFFILALVALQAIVANCSTD